MDTTIGQVETDGEIFDLEDRCDGLGNRFHFAAVGRHARRRIDFGEALGRHARAHRAEARDRGEQRLRVDRLRACEDLGGRTGLDHVAAEHHDRAVGDFGHHAHVVGDEQHAHVFLALQFAQQVEDLGLDRYIECRRRFVGDQQFRTAGKCHGNHHALAHAAGELVRIFVQPRLGGRDAHPLHQPHGFSFGLAPRQAAMQNQRFGNLVADGEDRIERGHRLLEDHADRAAADLAHFGFACGKQILAVEQDPALGARASRRQEPHGGKRRDAFAGAAFTHDRHRLTGIDGQADVADDGLPSFRRLEGGRQVFDRQNRRGRFYCVGHDQLSFASRGSTRSRRPSPSNCRERTENTMARPGNTISHGALFMYSRPEASIVPQVGMSVETPTPRKERLASASMAEAKTKVACTRMGDARLRRTWRSRICHVAKPMATAASL